MINPPISLRRTTAFRLSMIYAVSFCLLSILALVTAYQHILTEVNKQIDAGLRAEAASLAADWQSADQYELLRKIQRLSSQAHIDASNKGDAGPRLYLLVDATGQRLAGSIPSWQSALSQQSKASLTTLTLATPAALLHLVEGRPRFSLRSQQVQLSGGARLLVAQSLNELAELQSELLVLIAVIVLLMLGGGLWGGWWIGSRVIHSLNEVTIAAGNIMAGDLSQRIANTHLSDEFALLAERLNLMLARIESLMNELHEVTENVAHDLRTPLTRLRAQAENALQHSSDKPAIEALHNAISQTDALVATLDAIMSIARIEAGGRQEWRPIDLRQICQQAIDFYEPLAEEKQQTLQLQLPPNPAIILGNAQLLSQAIGNLLDNAIKYTPTEGRIQLELTAATSIQLSLRDNGPGIAPSLRHKALQRFVRLDNSRNLPGNGLGLALVAAIAAQHNGSLSLDNAIPSGLIVTLGFMPS